MNLTYICTRLWRYSKLCVRVFNKQKKRKF